MEAKIEDVNSVVSFLCAGVFRTGFGLEDERVSPFDCESRLNQV